MPVLREQETRQGPRRDRGKVAADGGSGLISEVFGGSAGRGP